MVIVRVIQIVWEGVCLKRLPVHQIMNVVLVTVCPVGPVNKTMTGKNVSEGHGEQDKNPLHGPHLMIQPGP